MTSQTGQVLPKSLDDVDPAFMTSVLRERGVISPTDEVVSQDERDVGMTAGYFSAIKKVACTYREATDAQSAFVVKTWPAFEMLPRENIAAMFARDIGGYTLPADRFYPRPDVHLAACDAAEDRWCLVMDDADSFAEHKVHECELDLDEVLRMIPKLVSMAVEWEGCHEGPKGRLLDELGVDLWAADHNISVYKAVMPHGAKISDRLTEMGESPLLAGRPWSSYVGGSDLAELFTTRIDAFYEPAHPRNGATCTLSHGDLRGDNIFFCDDAEAYPDGWLCIDFQLLFRGPVPSDLAYMMSTGTVLPEVYGGDGLQTVLRAFYDRFMDATSLYRDYSWDQFVEEFRMMSTVFYVYVVGMGASLLQASAFENEQAARVELGDRGATEADLTPEELRQRMWWTKFMANLGSNFATFGLYDHLGALPPDLDGLGEWTELPAHLR